MVKPPDQYATFTKNDSECFNIMVDPVPSAKISEETGLYEACQEVKSYIYSHRIWPKLENMLSLHLRL